GGVTPSAAEIERLRTQMDEALRRVSREPLWPYAVGECLWVAEFDGFHVRVRVKGEVGTSFVVLLPLPQLLDAPDRVEFAVRRIDGIGRPWLDRTRKTPPPPP